MSYNIYMYIYRYISSTDTNPIYNLVFIQYIFINEKLKKKKQERITFDEPGSVQSVRLF